MDVEKQIRLKNQIDLAVRHPEIIVAFTLLTMDVINHEVTLANGKVTLLRDVMIAHLEEHVRKEG